MRCCAKPAGMSGEIVIGNQSVARRRAHDRPEALLKHLALLVAIFFGVLSTYPFLLHGGTVLEGHDTPYHVLRLMGVAKALSQGDIPVRIQTVQIFGYGYPCSIYYGDLIMYPFAALYLLGVPLKICYVLMLLFVNCLCSMITYVVFSRMSGSKGVGIACSALWTFAPYRIEDLTLRGAFGEAAALSFLAPLANGLYSMFFRDGRGASRWGWVWCGVSAAAIILTHMLSTLVTLFVAVPIVIVLAALCRSKQSLLDVGKAALLCVLLACWYIVPFVDYYRLRGSEVVSLGVDWQSHCEAHAVLPRQFLSFFQPMRGGSIARGTSLDEMPYSMGFAQTIVLILSPAIMVASRQGDLSAVASGEESLSGFSVRLRRAIYILMYVIILFLLCLASSLFPWNINGGLFGTLVSLLASIQFPWRFVGPATFLTITLLVTLPSDMPGQGAARWMHLKNAVLLILAALAILEGLHALRTCDYGGVIEGYSASSLAAERSNGVFDNKYIPSEASWDSFGDIAAGTAPLVQPENIQGDASWKDWERVGTTVKGEFQASRGDEVGLPLFYYPYYQVHAQTTTGEDAGSYLHIVTGSDGTIALMFDKDFSGQVYVQFEEPWHWRLSEVISLTTCVGLLIAPLYKKTRSKGTAHEANHR